MDNWDTPRTELDIRPWVRIVVLADNVAMAPLTPLSLTPLYLTPMILPSIVPIYQNHSQSNYAEYLPNEASPWLHAPLVLAVECKLVSQTVGE
jgi:hypothetical protein